MTSSVPDEVQRGGEIATWFTTWRCNCTILTTDRAECVDRCPVHGEEMLVGYEGDGGVSLVSARSDVPFGFQEDHRKAELALFEVAS